MELQRNYNISFSDNLDNSSVNIPQDGPVSQNHRMNPPPPPVSQNQRMNPSQESPFAYSRRMNPLPKSSDTTVNELRSPFTNMVVTELPSTYQGLMDYYDKIEVENMRRFKERKNRENRGTID